MSCGHIKEDGTPYQLPGFCHHHAPLHAKKKPRKKFLWGHGTGLTIGTLASLLGMVLWNAPSFIATRIPANHAPQTTVAFDPRAGASASGLSGLEGLELTTAAGDISNSIYTLRPSSLNPASVSFQEVLPHSDAVAALVNGNVVLQAGPMASSSAMVVPDWVTGKGLTAPVAAQSVSFTDIVSKQIVLPPAKVLPDWVTGNGSTPLVATPASFNLPTLNEQQILGIKITN